jgi:hypothetical protein
LFFGHVDGEERLGIQAEAEAGFKQKGADQGIFHIRGAGLAKSIISRSKSQLKLAILACCTVS